MRNVFAGTMTLLVMAFFCPDQARAGLNIDLSFSLPPAIVFAEPPQMVVIPETYVYVAPDLGVDIFFHDGWWWRPWQGRWYRSQYYNTGWRPYRNVPSFYRSVPSGWRKEFKEKRWQGHEWRYQKIHPKDVRRHWRDWEKGKHWEKQRHWGVEGLHRQPQSRSPSGMERRRNDQPEYGKEQRRNDQPEYGKEQRHNAQPHGKEQRWHSSPQKREAPQRSHDQRGRDDREKGPGQERRDDRR